MTQSNAPIRIVALVSGTGSLLQALLDNSGSAYVIEKVIADVDCPALARAQAAGVATEVVELGKDRDEWNERLAESVGTPDLVVSTGFMRILGAPFLNRFEGRTINTHPALLPAFPGAHAVRDALSYGVKVTGSTVHFVDSGVDTGRIIAQEPVRVLDDDTEATLHERIKKVERELIVTVVRSARINPTTTKVEFA